MTMAFIPTLKRSLLPLLCGGSLFAWPGLCLGEKVIPTQPLETVTVSSKGLEVITDGISKGNVNDARAVMEEQLNLATDTVASEPLADDMAYFLRQRLLELGFADADVGWEIPGAAVLLHAAEGVRYTVGEITFEGNTSQEESELTSYLLRPTHEKMGQVSEHPYFIAVNLKDGADLVQRYLLGRGYLDATIEGPFFTPHPETSTQDVHVKIHEGKAYFIGDIQLTGDLRGQEKDIQEKLIDLTGKPFNEILLETARKDIVGIYQQRGYFSAAVILTALPKQYNGGAVPVKYDVQTGPLYQIAGVQVGPGFSDGAARIIRSSFKSTVGQVYSPADLETRNRRAIATDVFSRLDVTPKAITDDQVTLEITGSEGPTRTVAAFGGYETFKGAIIGGELRKVNIFDSGNNMQLKAEISALGINGGLEWQNPALFDTPYTLKLEVGAESVTIFGYDRQSYLARATFGRQWTRHIATSVFAEGSANTSKSDELTPEELGPDEYNIGLVGVALTLDYRDSPVLPTKGFYAYGAFSTAQDIGGGDASYLRTDLTFSYYQPITKKFRGALTAHTSAIQNDQGVEGVPIDLRLFNGGANSVRSFPEREMGLKSKTGTPLGGTLSQVFSVEFSYELRTNLELALFGDAGLLSREDDTIFTDSRSGSNELRYAIGLGIRYKLPVGPLRVDYGYNPDRKEGEPMGALHITFGFAF